MADRGRVAANAAFTLLEILLALALLGLLSAALVAGANHLLDSRVRAAPDIFWEAVREARRTALKGETEVRLRFDEKEKSFVVDGGDATSAFPVTATRDLSISFLPAQSGGGSILIGGVLSDSRSLPGVTFYGDGTCSPFRIQFRTGGAVQIIAIDPWTCAPILGEEKKT